MNRYLTNTIRFFMDGFLPPIIRDNKYFMYPFFYIAYKGKHIQTAMEFKSLIYTMSDEEYENIYKNLECIGNDRPTDLSSKCIRYILKNIEPSTKTVLDAGCGRGFFVKKLIEAGYQTYGCDVFDELKLDGCTYVQANIEKLPFRDKQFDVVICNHTLEHVKNFDKAVSELKRVAKNKLIITVPCQRYFYYTLDMHLHFFLKKEELEGAINIPKSKCKKIWGDWVYIGYLVSCSLLVVSCFINV